MIDIKNIINDYITNKTLVIEPQYMGQVIVSINQYYDEYLETIYHTKQYDKIDFIFQHKNKSWLSTLIEDPKIHIFFEALEQQNIQFVSHFLNAIQKHYQQELTEEKEETKDFFLHYIEEVLLKSKSLDMLTQTFNFAYQNDQYFSSVVHMYFNPLIEQNNFDAFTFIHQTFHSYFQKYAEPIIKTSLNHNRLNFFDFFVSEKNTLPFFSQQVFNNAYDLLGCYEAIVYSGQIKTFEYFEEYLEKHGYQTPDMFDNPYPFDYKDKFICFQERLIQASLLANQNEFTHYLYSRGYRFYLNETVKSLYDLNYVKNNIDEFIETDTFKTLQSNHNSLWEDLGYGEHNDTLKSFICTLYEYCPEEIYLLMKDVSCDLYPQAETIIQKTLEQLELKNNLEQHLNIKHKNIVKVKV